MKTIEAIDLYVKIANGKEVPKKVKYKDEIYEYHEAVHDYYCHSVAYLFDRVENLNEEVEIIEDTSKEDKKIAKIGRKARNITNQYLKDKLNEIIDKINGEENES